MLQAGEGLSGDANRVGELGSGVDFVEPLLNSLDGAPDAILNDMQRTTRGGSDSGEGDNPRRSW